MKCPSCGTGDQEGKFCAQCGAALQGACASCGKELSSGSRFCTSCGTPVSGARTGWSAGGGGVAGLPWPWLVAAGALVLVVLVFLLPGRTERAGPATMTTPGSFQGPAGAAGGTGAGGAGVPMSQDGLLSSDMRANADRLFNRIMGAAEQGNDAEVAQFMPMAVQAYGMVEDLDDDGRFHVAILHLTAGDHAAARAAAQDILDDSPDHILALGVAAAAAEAAGETEAARAFHRRLLDAYPEEAARPRPEYLDHQRMLPEYRRVAVEATD